MNNYPTDNKIKIKVQNKIYNCTPYLQL